MYVVVTRLSTSSHSFSGRRKFLGLLVYSAEDLEGCGVGSDQLLLAFFIRFFLCFADFLASVLNYLHLPCIVVFYVLLFLSTDPPSSPPLISGIQDGGHSEGETLTLSCSVTGGKPPISFVSFLCGQGPGDSPDTTSTVNSLTTVTSYLTFERLDSTVNGTVCRCSPYWKEDPSRYTQTATATITVIGVYLCILSYKAPYLGCNLMQKRKLQ